MFQEVKVHFQSFAQYINNCCINMGSSNSSEQKSEERTIDSNGQVNNNIIIRQAEDNHQQVLINEKMLYATHTLILFEVIKLAIYLYTACRNKLKKKYVNRAADPVVNLN